MCYVLCMSIWQYGTGKRQKSVLSLFVIWYALCASKYLVGLLQQIVCKPELIPVLPVLGHFFKINHKKEINKLIYRVQRKKRNDGIEYKE